MSSSSSSSSSGSVPYFPGCGALPATLWATFEVEACVYPMVAQLTWNGSRWVGSSGPLKNIAFYSVGTEERPQGEASIDFQAGICSHQDTTNPGLSGHQCLPQFGFWGKNYGFPVPDCCDTAGLAWEVVVGQEKPVITTYPEYVPPRPRPCCRTSQDDCCSPPGGGSGGHGPLAGGGPWIGGGPVGGGIRSLPGGAGDAVRGGMMGDPFAGGGGPSRGGKGPCCHARGGSGVRGGGGFGIRGGGGLDPPAFSRTPVRYSTGELAISAVDLASDGYGIPWGHTRSFASRLSGNANVGSGYNWQVEQWPYLVFRDDGSIVVMGAAHDVLWFDPVAGGYAARVGVKSSLTYEASTNSYTLVDLDGRATSFDALTGRFFRHASPSGETTEVLSVGSNGLYPWKVRRWYVAGATVTTEEYLYEYHQDEAGESLLDRVTLRRRVDSGYWTNVARVQYTYYAGTDSRGGLSDLQTVTTQVWNGSQWQSTGTTLYRYYRELPAGSSSSSSAAGGDVHLLKYVVNPAAFERLQADPEVTDPLTASDVQVAQYADNYFEYDEQRRVTRETVNGGSQTYQFTYSESAHADGYNAWKYKTVETLPEGSQNIVYTDYAGQVMLAVLKSGSDQWCEFWKYGENARVLLHANPSAVSGYDEQYADLLHEVSGNYQYLKDSEGLIDTFEYHAASGYVTVEKIQQGELGTAIKLREYEYLTVDLSSASSGSSSSSSGGAAPSQPAAYFLIKETVYPSDTDQTKQVVTTYDHTFYEGTCQVLQRTTTLPVVSADQNGSGVAATRKEVFDPYGNLIWIMDERGFITRLKYDVVTGAVTQRIDDVDTAQVSDEPAGWETPTGGGLHLVTDFEHDDLGDGTQTLGPIHTVDINGTATSIRSATWTVYDDANHQIRTASGYASGASYDTYTLINPVSITKFDEAGNVLEQIQAVRGSTSGKLLPTDTFAQTAYVAWTTHQYTECCVLDSTRVYHRIPNSGVGQSGVNYSQTDFEYNANRVMNRQKTPGGTITFTVFDARSNPSKIYVGTDDTGATTGDPTGDGAQGNNMVVVTENEYDSGNDGGDGNLTKVTQHVDASTTRVTSFTFDWRNRGTDTDGEIDFYEKLYYDNLDRATKTERYDTTLTGNLIARSETKFDDRGRVYQTIRYGVNPSTGAVGNSLTDNTWYDAAGNIIKSLPSGAKGFTKNAYDGLGRRIKQSLGYDLDETAYSEASTLSDDTLLEQTEFAYDAASNVIETTLKQRYHNATGTGELNGPSGVQPKSRITYTAAWHDPLGRTIATADYGTNGGSSLTRPGTVPARSDTVLVTSMTYNSAGQLSTTTNPGGIVTYVEYDAARRQVTLVLNWTVGSSSSSSSSSSSGPFESDDVNVTVRTAYNADGNVSSITAENSITGDQTTKYVYGTTLSDSGIASSLLKRAEIYPDSDDVADPLGNGSDGIYDRIEFKYNRQGEQTEIKDQNETVHAFDYDQLGRRTHDRVTALGSGVDGAVRRISTSYEVRGMAQKMTSWNGEAVGSGSVVNEVQFAYNDFGRISDDYQAHGGTVNTSTTPKVQYGYADGSANTIRPTTITYPDGRVITFSYGAADSMNDALSRIGSIVDDDAGSTHLADYSYLGIGPVRGSLPTVNSPFTPGAVEVDYTEPDIKYTLVGTAGGNDSDTGDIYRGLDRFGGIKDCYWYNYGTSTDVDRIKYGYDRNGNRTYRENTVATAAGAYFDEKYLHDLIDRLKSMDRGRLNDLKSQIQNLQFAQQWGLDATGNWRSFLEDSDGNGTWGLDQTRSANKVSEIADINETTGPSWVTPVYNRAGNMTTIPKPADPTQSFAATYDAWNRLVRIEEGANKVAEYEYDGAKRRTVNRTYVAGQLDETRHFFYADPSRWQVVEERVGSSTNADRQFVWGLRYVDELVLRDRDTTGDGSLDERMYGMQDANWNVTGIASSMGAVQERYTYHPYGTPMVLTPAFAPCGSSSFDWETVFGGYRWDAAVQVFHIRNRIYAAQIGSWLQRDPRGIAVDINLYSYGSVRPLSATDPSGEGLVVAAFGCTVCGISLFIGALTLVVCAVDVCGHLWGNTPPLGVPPNSGNNWALCFAACIGTPPIQWWLAACAFVAFLSCWYGCVLAIMFSI